MTSVDTVAVCLFLAEALPNHSDELLTDPPRHPECTLALIVIADRWTG